MAELIRDFVYIGVASTAPGMITAVILMLSSEGGFQKALAFHLGRVAYYIVVGFVLLAVAERVIGIASESAGEDASTAPAVIKTMVGVLLLALAIRSFLAADDPDAPPAKWVTGIDKAGAVSVFGLGVLLGLVGIRFLALTFNGVTDIAAADLSAPRTAAAVLVLVVFLTWPTLLPVLVYVSRPTRSHTILGPMNVWVKRHSSAVTGVVLGLVGLGFLIDGLIGLEILG
jgi:hypothetical protein